MARTAAPKDMDASQFERLLANAGRLSVVFLGLLALLVALHTGQVFLAPVTLAIIVGLMFGPVADRLERVGVPPVLSAALVVLMLIAVIALGIALFAVPLSEWVRRAPVMWQR